jgi:ribosomal protein L12E/L44/L45/RPP1/RPP2
VPPQPEPQLDSPQYAPQEEDNFKIVAIVPAGGDTHEAQQLSQNDNHDDDHEEEENEEEDEEEGNCNTHFLQE